MDLVKVILINVVEKRSNVMIVFLLDQGIELLNSQGIKQEQGTVNETITDGFLQTLVV